MRTLFGFELFYYWSSGSHRGQATEHLLFKFRSVSIDLQPHVTSQALRSFFQRLSQSIGSESARQRVHSLRRTLVFPKDFHPSELELDAPTWDEMVQADLEFVLRRKLDGILCFNPSTYRRVQALNEIIEVWDINSFLERFEYQAENDKTLDTAYLIDSL